MSNTLVRRVCAGIDLGTTNSLVGVLFGGEVSLARSSDGDTKTPSCVGYLSNGNVVVGTPARNQFLANPTRSFRSFKRKMGGDWATLIDGSLRGAEDFSAEILRYLRFTAERSFQATVDRAVVTVPAYFGERERLATARAAEQAGLVVMALLNEPTAAALDFAFTYRITDANLMVADLGGGTFDVSVVRIGGRNFEVLATAGDRNLGGDDWDQLLCDHILDAASTTSGVRLSDDLVARSRVVEAAEVARRELSHALSTSISLPFLGSSSGGPVHVDLPITRPDLDLLAAPLLDRCGRLMRLALAESGLDCSELDHVVLVGGAAQMPALSVTARNITGKEPIRPIQPDEAVVRGAAIYAGMLDGVVTGSLKEITPLTLGVQVIGGRNHVLVERNTPLPARVTHRFTTAADGQRSAVVRVLQGDRPNAVDNRTVASFELRGIPAMPRGQARIEVTYCVDANGMLSASACELSSGARTDLSVRVFSAPSSLARGVSDIALASGAHR